MEHAGPDDITRELTIRTLRPDGRLECTTVLPISDETASLCRSLGRASGTDLGTLLMMARKHCPGFTERVASYRVVETLAGAGTTEDADQTATTIEFFERGER